MSPATIADTVHVIDATGVVTLEPSAHHTFRFRYAVSTDRVATIITAELRDATGAAAAGWSMDITSHPATSSGSSSVVEDQAAVMAGDTIDLAIAVTSPPALESSSTVTLHLSSTVHAHGGLGIRGVADLGTLATIHAEPLPHEVPQSVGPMSIENGSSDYGAVACTTADGRQRAEPGQVITFNCVYTVRVPLLELRPRTSTIVTIASTNALSMVVSSPGSSPAQSSPVTTSHTFTNTSARANNATFAFQVAVTVSQSGAFALSSSATLDNVIGEDSVVAAGSASLTVTAGSVSVDNNNAEVMECDTPSSLQVGPGGRIDILCTAYTGLLNLGGLVGSMSFTVTSPGEGWQVIISNRGLLGGSQLAEITDGPNPVSATYAVNLADILQVANMRFRVSLVAPAEVPESSVRAAVITMRTGSRTDAVSVFDGITVLAPITSDANGLVPNLLVDLECTAPGGQEVNPGGSVTYSCALEGLAGLQITLAQLQPTMRIDTGGAGWRWSLAHGTQSFSGAGDVSLDLALIGVDLLADNQFDLTLSPPCTYAGDTLVGATVTADLNLGALGLLDLGLVSVWSNIPTAVRPNGDTAWAPTVAASDAAFGTSTWTGSGYPALDSSLTLAVGPILAGCTSPTWSVQITGESMTREGGSETIPIENMTYVGGSSTGGLTSVAQGFAIGSEPATIATGTSAVTEGSQITIDLSLSPPDTSPPGAYSGTLTFTTAAGQ